MPRRHATYGWVLRYYDMYGWALISRLVQKILRRPCIIECCASYMTGAKVTKNRVPSNCTYFLSDLRFFSIATMCHIQRVAERLPSRMMRSETALSLHPFATPLHPAHVLLWVGTYIKPVTCLHLSLSRRRFTQVAINGSAPRQPLVEVHSN